MLNGEQIAYIEILRRDFSALDDATIRKTLTDAGWTGNEVQEALLHFHGKAPSTVPNSTQVVSEHTQVKDVTKPEVTTPAKTVVAKTDPVTIESSTPSIKPTSTEADTVTVREIGLGKEPPSIKNSEVQKTTESHSHTETQVDTKAQLHKTVQNKSTQSSIKNDAHTSFLNRKKLIVVCVALFALSAVGVLGYYLTTHTSLFDTSKFTNETIFKHIFTKLAEIDTATYNLDLTIQVEDREEGAHSFIEARPLSDEERFKFERDQDRIRDVANIRDALDESRQNDEFEYIKPYPKTLQILDVNINDPLGKEYLYAVTPDGLGYTLIVTFETLDVIVAIKENAYSFYDEDERINGTTVTFNQDDYITEQTFSGKPMQPRLFGFLDVAQLEELIPSDFYALLHSGGTLDSNADEVASGQFEMSGEVKFGDAQFAFGFEAIKEAERYFGVIHKIPSLFGELSNFKGTWVVLTPSDFEDTEYGAFLEDIVKNPETENENLSESYKEQFRTIIETADAHGFLQIEGDPEVYEKDGQKLTKYTLRFVPAKIVPFYEAVTSALSSHEKPLIKKDETFLSQLQSPDMQELLTYIEQNVTLEISFDRKGFPTILSTKVRYVPSPDIQTLKDKQLTLTSTVSFTKINELVVVTPPEEYITFDDALAEITSMSKAEILANRQKERVERIRRGLELYYSWTGMYPQTLDELTKKRSEVAAKNDVHSDEYGVYSLSYEEETNEAPFMHSVPLDVYTKAAFGYLPVSKSYELTYTMEIPPFKDAKSVLLYYTYAQGQDRFYESLNDGALLYVAQFTNGKNVATPEYLSKVESEIRDTDYDALADTLEILIATDPKKEDSDSDGFSDSDEFLSGSNPLGPGRLRESESLFY